MPLESALTELRLAKGDLAQARPQAERHLALSRETVMKLANSLPTEEPLRQTHLPAPVGSRNPWGQC
jgi:hypothetical protein